MNDALINQVHCLEFSEMCARVEDASIDMILCDPPYQVTACSWDTVIPFDVMWSAFKRIIKPKGAIVLTASQPFTSALVMSNVEMFKYVWTWVKNSVSSPALAKIQPLRITEDVLVFNAGCYYPQGLERFDKVVNKGTKAGGDVWYGGTLNQGNDYLQEFTNYPRNVIYCDRPSMNVHPSQKPIALFEYLIRTYTLEGELVLDPTCGSGTTALASVKTGRNFICSDFTPEYVDIARKRLQDADPYQPKQVSATETQLSLLGLLGDSE